MQCVHFTALRRAACGLALAAALVAIPAPRTLAQALEVKEVVLDNGMTVLLYPRKGDPNVACGWVAKVGSVNEWPGITGLSHLFEHMMFKGTHVIGTKDAVKDIQLNAEQDRVRAELRKEQSDLDRRARLGEIDDPNDPAVRSPRHQELLKEFTALLAEQKTLLIDNEFDKVYTQNGGSGMNAGTTYDLTIYFINLPSNKLELWFWMEADRLANPVFRQFYSERDVVWEERRMRTDSTPTGRLDEQFDAMFWQASPYGWPVIGWPSDLDGITREEAVAYFHRNYAPNNLTAALVGDFDPAQAEALARRYFGPLKRSAEPPAPMRTFEPEQLAMKRLEGEAETRPTVKVRYPAVPHGHVDEPALAVLAELLNGRTGRLNKALVLERKIASTASASQEGRRYGGFFQLTGVAATGHEPEEVEAALYEQVRRLQSEPVGDRELQKVKNATLADKFRRLDSNYLVLIQLLFYDVLGDWREMNTEADKLLAVTAADVQRVANKYFVDHRRNVAVYRTKKAAGAEEAVADPAFDALSAEQQAMAGQVKAQLDAVKDPAQLEAAIGQFSSMKAQVPPEAQAVMDWAEGYARKKLDALKGGPK